MNTIRLSLAILTLCGTGLAQASEITEFAIPSTSAVSRQAVQAEVRKLNKMNLLRVDFLGPVAVDAPRALKSREQVRMEAESTRGSASVAPDANLVGG